MTWSGYVALGTLASGVFTESTATGYARLGFNFNSQVNGKVQGYGANLSFSASSAVVTTYNALAFYNAVSGGDAILVYPFLNKFSYGTGVPYVLNPYVVILNALDGVSHEGVALDTGAVRVISGLDPNEQTFSVSAAITAHAAGGQSSAVLLTSTVNSVTTVATAGDSVKLPLATAGAMIVVGNTGANALAVFPSTGDTVNGLAANASVSLMPGEVDTFFSPAAGAWVVQIGVGYAASLPTVSCTDGITAHAAGGQASAVVMTSSINRVTTVGTAADSVALPLAVPGLEITVINAAASNSMNVYPVNGGSDAINALAANAAFAVAANKTATFFCPIAAHWHSVLSA